MKLVFVPILLLLVLIQTFSKWVIWADYELNKEYVAKVLCENRKKPMLHCNGRCQLAKKMAAEEADAKKSASNSTMAKMKFSETLFDDYSPVPTVSAPAENCVAHTTATMGCIPITYTDPVFHPPLT